MNKKILIIGAGISGLTIGRLFAEKENNVLIIDKRNHIGGNCYDEFDENGNYIQKYGPHIFHTNDEIVWDFIKSFSEFNNYEHKVLGEIDENLINIPFNLNSLHSVFKEDYDLLKKRLIEKFGIESKVPILDLKEINSKEFKEIADFVYNKIFLNYTLKQWDLKPEEIDKNVTARVPIFISYDNRYFQDKFQGIPVKGFTKLFENMINHSNIKVKLNLNYKDLDLSLFDEIYYTGPLDAFFSYKFGKIKYRRINLKFEKYNTDSFQINSVINYPNTEKFTRITEFNKFLFIKNSTSIITKEYSSWKEGFMAYPVQSLDNQKIIDMYLDETKKLNNIHFVGRLAECKYYNMDQAIKRGLDLIEK